MKFAGQPRGLTVGRLYAGILGHLAMLTVIVRGLRGGAGSEATLLVASLALAGFAVLGYIAGALASSIVEQSVRTRIAEEIDAHAAKDNAA
jgi:hypothetical protein